jgi:hypothetical protein
VSTAAGSPDPVAVSAGRPTERSWTARARRALVWLAPFLIALAGYLVGMREMQPPFTADEPHYALEAFSLALDGDRDLSNDYGDIHRVLAATDGQTTTLQSHAYRYTAGGPLISMHHVGLPLLLAPAARISQTVTALQLEMVILAAIAAQLLFGILAKLVPRHGRTRWAVWAIVVFGLPVLGYSTRLYPEMVAALLVLGVVRILLNDRLRWPAVLGAAVLIAYLPWLHVRFGVLAAGLVIATVARMIEVREGSWRRLAATGTIALAVPLIVSLGVMSLEFQRWYGTHSLTAQLHSADFVATAPAPAATPPPAAAGTATQPGAAAPSGAGASTPTAPAPDVAAPDTQNDSVVNDITIADVVPGVARELLSSRNGWMAFLPVGLLALAGAVALALRRRWWMGFGLLVVFAYMAQIAATGVLPAYALPGRYEMVYLPLVAIPLLLVLVEVRWARYVFWPLVAAGAIITLSGMTHADGLVPFTSGTARADIGPANPLLRPWPTVSRESAGSNVDYTIGVCAGRHPGAAVRGCGDAGSLAVPSGGATRVIWTGAQRRLPAGEYSVAVGLQRTGGAPTDGRLAAQIEIFGDGTPLVSEPVTVQEIPQGDYRAFIRPIRLPAAGVVGVRVTTSGAVGLRVTQASARSSVSALTGLLPQGSRFPDRPAVLAWIAVIVLLAGALAASMRRRLPAQRTV